MNKSFVIVILASAILGLTACSTTPTQNQVTQPLPTETKTKPVEEPENTLASTDTSGIMTNKTANTFNAQTKEAVGGTLIKSMDPNDKIKMSRSLDKAIGKTTSWKNEVTGVSYTVTPNKKLTIDGNHFCREYSMTAAKGEMNQELTETACIGQDGEWHPAG